MRDKPLGKTDVGGIFEGEFVDVDGKELVCETEEGPRVFERDKSGLGGGGGGGGGRLPKAVVSKTCS